MNERQSSLHTEVQKPETDDPYRPLIRRIQEGDRDAFSELEAKLKPYIMGMVRNRVRQEELVGLGMGYEDFVQDILIKIWKGMTNYKEEAVFKTWFVAIASNHIIDVLRRIQRKKETLFDATGDDDAVMARVDRIPAQDPSPLARLVRKEERSQLVAAIESLPPKQREVVRLRMIEGLSYAEIAEKMEVSEGTVKAHMFHGRKGVARFFKKMGWSSH